MIDRSTPQHTIEDVPGTIGRTLADSAPFSAPFFAPFFEEEVCRGDEAPDERTVDASAEAVAHHRHRADRDVWSHRRHRSPSTDDETDLDVGGHRRFRPRLAGCRSSRDGATMNTTSPPDTIGQEGPHS